MSELDALLAGIVAHPHEHVRWLIMADWLEDHGFPERAELVRVHRELLRTCTEPDAHPERPQLHARMMELMRSGVLPCIPQKTLTLPGGVGLKMSFIPPGSFLMGSPETEVSREEDEKLHHVTLTKGFWLGQTPVTQAQWVAVDGNSNLVEDGELPMGNLSWQDTQAFCAATTERTGLVFRLLTEAEWEFASRAGTTTPFYWGTTLNGEEANCSNWPHYGTSDVGPVHGGLKIVGCFSNRSPHPWNLVDILGSVGEWCSDWYSEYASNTNCDPQGPANGDLRVKRGGGWYMFPSACRAAIRSRYAPATRYPTQGFRIAADLE